METPTLTIDFGTSRTKVAFFDESTGKPGLVEIGKEIRTVLPSVFYIPKEGQGERLVGDDAQDMVDIDPGGIVLSLKKEIHKLGKKRCGERPSIGRIQLASELFSYIYKRCQREVFHDENILRCRLTVPSDFRAPQRDAIRQAAELGGFRGVTTIDEPVAAAQAWLRNHSGEKFGDSVVVCDVGGGTTDFAFLRYAEGRFEADEEVLSAGFSEGGNDLDVLIWEKICENSPINGALDELVSGFLIKIRRERELIAKTKKSESTISVNGQQRVLKREIIEEATAEFIERVKNETGRFLKTIGDKNSRAPILLVGGASRLPGLDDALKTLNSGNVYLWSDSDYATVLGAVEIPAARTAKPTSQDKANSFAEDAKTTPAVDSETINSMIGDGRSDEAFSIVSQHMTKDSNPDLFALWIECGITVADANKVLATAREIHIGRNKDSLGACCLANAMIDVGRKNEAKDLISPFITNKFPSSYELLWTQYYLNPNAQIIEELQKMTPDSPRLLAEKAAIALFQGEDRNAGESAGLCLGTALRLNPNCFIALFVKLFAEMEFGFFTNQTEFEESLRQIKRISPNNFFTRYINGLYLVMLGDYSAAIPMLDQAISDPRSQGADVLLGLIYLYRSRCYFELKDLISARTSVENSLRLIPNNCNALALRGDLLANERKYEEAIQDYSSALNLNPEISNCIMGRAFCFFKLIRYDEAAKDYEAACRIEPKNQLAKDGAVFSIIYNILRNVSPIPPCFYLRPNIPQDKLNKAYSSYLVPNQMQDVSRIILMFSAGSWGEPEEGFCLTQEGIYWRNTDVSSPNSQGAFYISYSDIQSVSASSTDMIVNARFNVPAIERRLVSITYHQGLVKQILDSIVQLQKRIQIGLDFRGNGGVENLTRDVKDICSWKIKAASSVQQQRYADAFTEFSKILAIVPTDIESLLGKADCFLTSGQLENAARIYETVRKLTGDKTCGAKSLVYSAIAEMLNKAIDGMKPELFLSPNIPEARLQGATKSYILPLQKTPGESVLLLHDGTMTGSGEDGFCLTENGIYCHNSWNHGLRYARGRDLFFLQYCAIEDVKTQFNKVTANGKEIYGLLDGAKVFHALLYRLHLLCTPHFQSEQSGSLETNTDVQYYYGHCKNITYGLQAALSLRIIQTNQRISGFLELFGLGGSGEIEGTFSGSNIIFTTNDLANGLTIEWRGNLTGNSIEGSYNVIPVTHGKDSVQNGIWTAHCFEK